MVIVRRGSWLYAGSVRRPVDIVGLPYDFWFERAKADDQLEPGETAQELGDEGLLYYERYVEAGKTDRPTWPDSAGHQTVEAAMLAAATRVPGEILWE